MNSRQTTGIGRAVATVALGVAACIASTIAQPAGIQAASRYQAVQQGTETIKLGP